MNKGDWHSCLRRPEILRKGVEAERERLKAFQRTFATREEEQSKMSNF